MKWLIVLIFLITSSTAIFAEPTWQCVAKDSTNLTVIICPKYSACYSDTGTVLMQSETQIVLTRRDGTKNVLERANTNSVEEVTDGR